MPRTRAKAGELKQYEEPAWAPLLRLVGRRVVADFRWMHEIELADGTAVHAHKHIDTRRYIHLGLSGLAGVERQVDEPFAVLERCRRGEYPVPW